MLLPLFPYSEHNVRRQSIKGKGEEREGKRSKIERGRDTGRRGDPLVHPIGSPLSPYTT